MAQPISMKFFVSFPMTALGRIFELRMYPRSGAKLLGSKIFDIRIFSRSPGSWNLETSQKDSTHNGSLNKSWDARWVFVNYKGGGSGKCSFARISSESV
jgi:hypothetical protein